MKQMLLITCLICSTGEAFSQTQYKVSKQGIVLAPVDSITRKIVREVIVVYVKVPGWIHTENGYALQENGVCVAHYRDNWKQVKLPLKLWDCETHRDNGHKKRE